MVREDLISRIYELECLCKKKDMMMEQKKREIIKFMTVLEEKEMEIQDLEFIIVTKNTQLKERDDIITQIQEAKERHAMQTEDVLMVKFQCEELIEQLYDVIDKERDRATWNLQQLWDSIERGTRSTQTRIERLPNKKTQTVMTGIDINELQDTIVRLKTKALDEVVKKSSSSKSSRKSIRTYHSLKASELSKIQEVEQNVEILKQESLRESKVSDLSQEMANANQNKSLLSIGNISQNNSISIHENQIIEEQLPQIVKENADVKVMVQNLPDAVWLKKINNKRPILPPPPIVPNQLCRRQKMQSYTFTPRNIRNEMEQADQQQNVFGIGGYRGLYRATLSRILK